MLPLDSRRLRDLRSLLRSTNAENRALPLITLGSKLLILSRLAANTIRQLDIREDRILLRHRDVGLAVLNNVLRLLLGLREALLSRCDVPLVDVLNVLRVGIVDRVFLRLLRFLVHLPYDAVELVRIVLDLLLDRTLNGRTESADQNGFADGKE